MGLHVCTLRFAKQRVIFDMGPCLFVDPLSVIEDTSDEGRRYIGDQDFTKRVVHLKLLVISG
jgi:hypothetical protein